MLRNLTLAAMCEADLAFLSPHLTSCRVERGEVLTAQGADVEAVFFPTTAHLANTVTFSDGRWAETFIMGVEGVSALAPFLAGSPCAWAVEVKVSGEAYRVPAAVLSRRVDESPTLRRQLLRLTNDYQSQAAFGVGCAALHGVAPRLARFILAIADRNETDQIALTQQDMAELLGSQRTTVNSAAQELKTAQAIRYSRGRIRIVDRALLARMSCECYELQKSVLS